MHFVVVDDAARRQERQLEAIERATLDKPITVWLKLDSGMHRVGLHPADYQAAYRRLLASGKVAKIVLMSHFARADERANAAGTDDDEDDDQASEQEAAALLNKLRIAEEDDEFERARLAAGSSGIAARIEAIIVEPQKSLARVLTGNLPSARGQGHVDDLGGDVSEGVRFVCLAEADLHLVLAGGLELQILGGDADALGPADAVAALGFPGAARQAAADQWRQGPMNPFEMVAVIVVASYLALNMVVIGNGLMHIAAHPELFSGWRAGLDADYPSVFMMIGVALISTGGSEHERRMAS